MNKIILSGLSITLAFTMGCAPTDTPTPSPESRICPVDMLAFIDTYAAELNHQELTVDSRSCGWDGDISPDDGLNQIISARYTAGDFQLQVVRNAEDEESGGFSAYSISDAEGDFIRTAQETLDLSTSVEQTLDCMDYLADQIAWCDPRPGPIEELCPTHVQNFLDTYTDQINAQQPLAESTYCGWDDDILPDENLNQVISAHYFAGDFQLQVTRNAEDEESGGFSAWSIKDGDGDFSRSAQSNMGLSTPVADTIGCMHYLANRISWCDARP